MMLTETSGDRAEGGSMWLFDGFSVADLMRAARRAVDRNGEAVQVHVHGVRQACTAGCVQVAPTV